MERYFNSTIGRINNGLLISFLSLIALPIYGQQNPNTIHAIGLKEVIHSAVLEEEREIYVHVPKGFFGMDNNGEVYPVVYVLDGESQFLSTVSTIEYLSSAALGNDVIPRMIVVGIPNTNRDRDLTPSKGLLGNDSTTLAITGGGPKFIEFIKKEVIPYVDKKYPTTNHRTIIGHSLGGLLVLQALITESELFDNYLAIDPFLRFDNESFLQNLIQSLEKEDLASKKLFVATATTLPSMIQQDQMDSDSSEIVKLTKVNWKFRSSSKSNTWKLDYKNELYQENHFLVPLPATYDALKYFYQYYAYGEMINYYHPAYREKKDLVEQIEAHYLKISNQLGYTIKPMQSYINSFAFGLKQFGRSDLSIDLFDYNIRLYPDNVGVYNAKGFFLLNSGDHPAAAKLFEQSLSMEDQPSIREILDGIK